MSILVRRTRGRRNPSLGQMARLGKSIAKQSEGRVGEKCLPVGGRVRMSRAVGASLARPQERRTFSLFASFRPSTYHRGQASGLLVLGLVSF